ncbi:MAG: hypothetical protein K0S30_124 [Clostridia bacterium]|nr:hypothetical protein [Clostridia bacterium]
MESLKHKLGWGSLSVVLLILGLGFSITFGNGMCIGDYVLREIGIRPWSEGNTGTHYTLFYSMIFLLPAWYVGDKYKEDYGADIGKSMAVIFNVLIMGWFMGYLF